MSGGFILGGNGAGSSASERAPEPPPIPPLREFEVQKEMVGPWETVHAHEAHETATGSLAFYSVREVEGVGRASTMHRIIAEGEWLSMREIVAPPVPVEFATSGLLN